MADPQAIMEGIEVRLLTIPGLRAGPEAPAQINPPHAFVGVPAIENYVTGATPYQRPTLAPTITVLVSAAWNRTGQLDLAAYASPVGTRSIPAALNADRTLGGAVNDLQVVRFDPLGLEEVGLIGFFGGRFTLRIIT